MDAWHRLVAAVVQGDEDLRTGPTKLTVETVIRKIPSMLERVPGKHW